MLTRHVHAKAPRAHTHTQERVETYPHGRFAVQQRRPSPLPTRPRESKEIVGKDKPRARIVAAWLYAYACPCTREKDILAARQIIHTLTKTLAFGLNRLERTNRRAKSVSPKFWLAKLNFSIHYTRACKHQRMRCKRSFQAVYRSHRYLLALCTRGL